MTPDDSEPLACALAWVNRRTEAQMVDQRFVPAAWMGKPVLRAEDLAPILEIHMDDLYRMAKNGEIPGSYKLGNRRLFRTQTVVAWLAGVPAADLDHAA
jgi:excisionase family DNA binding protein